MKLYTSNSIGAKSIDLFHSVYSTFAEPVLPYLQTPYSIVSPYLAQADSLGNKSLDTVDTHFPAVKSTDFESLKSSAFNLAHFPFKVAGEGRDYVTGTYQDEYKKTGGQGITTTGKAVISTEMRIVAETMRKVADYLGPKKDQAEAEYEKMKSLGADKVQKAKKSAQDKQAQMKEQVNSH